MSEAGSVDDPLAGWDPRRRKALEDIWAEAAAAGGKKMNLVDELIREHRAEAKAQDEAQDSPPTRLL